MPTKVSRVKRLRRLKDRTTKRFELSSDVANAVQQLANEDQFSWVGTAENLLRTHPRVQAILEQVAA